MDEVTEMDFRLPEYRNVRPEDYEFSPDGKPVRKDRFEFGMRTIAVMLGVASRADFKIRDVVDGVEKLAIGAIRAAKAKEAAERVGKFLDEHARMRGLDKELIAGLHENDEREALLLASDLRALIDAVTAAVAK